MTDPATEESAVCHRTTSPSDRRRTPRTSPIAGLLLATLVVAACGESASSARPAPGVLLEIAVSDEKLGGNVAEDQLVLEGLIGPVAPSESAVRAAACHNVENWLDDHTLDDNTVIAASPDLLRVAELVGRGTIDAEFAKLVEYQRWHSSAGLVVDDAMTKAGFDRSDLEDYLRLTAEPPGGDAAQNFVVYAAARKMSEFVVIYAQVDDLSTGRTSNGRFPNVSTWVAGEDGLIDATFAETDCER